MRAVVFDLSLVRYGLAKALGKKMPALYYGKPSCLSLREVGEPTLRGPAWAKVAVEACGFCGSDLSTILLKYSPSLSPFSSMPCVLGHEIFGRLSAVGADARSAGFKEGDRVSVNPAFGCLVRNISPLCPACASGHPATCHFAGTHAGGLAAGFSIGFHKDLGGGFSESLIAHRSQLFHLPDAVPDERAVLVEPIAIGLHAVLKRPPQTDEEVLIIGGGMIAYSVLAALRLLGFRNKVTQLLLLDFQAERARALGADEVIKLGPGVDVLDEVCRRTGAHRHKPLLGRDVLTGGWPVTFDCVGSPESMRDALAFTRSQGTVVLVGNAGILPKLDVTTIWSHELSLVGTAYYGPEPLRDHQHTLALAGELLSEEAARPLDALITHHYPLESYEEAVVANIERGRFRSVKTVFHPRQARSFS
ncbi:MAG TPA: alcohol dehydrogenase catalytic domain-containing protein [Polyangia bacterium]